MTCPPPSSGMAQLGREVPAPQWTQQGLGRLTPSVCVGGVVLDCPEGRWGLGCQEICPPCEHDATCAPETGACLCRPGFTGSRCQDGECLLPPPQPCLQSRPAPCPTPATLSLSPPAACPAGWFGPSCQTRCSCANDGLCHPVTGRCNCAPGWTGLSCQRGRWPGVQASLPTPDLAAVTCSG